MNTHIPNLKKQSKKNSIGQLVLPTLCGKYLNPHCMATDDAEPTCDTCRGLEKANTKLIIEILQEEITISLESGVEVVHWVEDEWIEDPTILPAIANAIHMAHTTPDKLINMNIKHINSQLEMAT